MTPEQTNEMRKMDEAMTFIVDNYPRIWRKLYENCIKEGFTEDQSLQLLRTYILSVGGVRA